MIVAPCVDSSVEMADYPPDSDDAHSGPGPTPPRAHIRVSYTYQGGVMVPSGTRIVRESSPENDGRPREDNPPPAGARGPGRTPAAHRPSPAVPTPEAAPRWYLDLVLGGCVFLAAAGLNAIANFNDVRAFAAIATPATYAWLCLGLLCWGGLVFSSTMRKRGLQPPGFFRVAMFVGVACALISVPNAWRVLTKATEAAPHTDPVARLDLRGRRLANTSYAESDLTHALMTSAQLIHVDLSGANLSEVDLRDARLVDVDLSTANLCGADIRGADLRGARNIENVRNWAYAFYDDKTRLPADLDFVQLLGPVKDTGRGLLYACRTNRTRRIAAEPAPRVVAPRTRDRKR